MKLTQSTTTGSVHFDAPTITTSKPFIKWLSNSNTDFIKNLYAGYNINIVPVKRNINRNGNARHGEEVIITNYKSIQI